MPALQDVPDLVEQSSTASRAAVASWKCLSTTAAFANTRSPRNTPQGKTIWRKGQLCKSAQTPRSKYGGTFSSEMSAYPQHGYFLYPREVEGQHAEVPQSLRPACLFNAEASRLLPAHSPARVLLSSA